MTIPLGEGIHRRMVYVELEDGAKLDEVTAAIKADPYFASDETHVFQVESVDDVRDMGHGVNLVRKGVSGKTQNQRLEFNMSINNSEPAPGVQYEHQQPRPHRSGAGECGPCLHASAARLLHDGRDSCDRYAPRRPCRFN